MEITSKSLEISIIIPVRNGGDDFKRCIDAVAALDPAPDETVVVADGESDGAWRLGESIGAKIIRLSQAVGPGQARNQGVSFASGAILFFLDADVVLPTDAVRIVREILGQQNGPDAVFGSYDDRPGKPNFLSQYKNLFHHYIHQTSNSEAATFWAGCGAIRRKAFESVGGFSEIYRMPSIEDIELGYRLKEAGFRIYLAKNLQVTHLKRWALGSLLKADILRRALPWSELILSRGPIPDDLNLKITSRISAACALLLCLSLGMMTIRIESAIPAAVMALTLLLLNAKIYLFFIRKRGIGFGLKTIPWHWFYYVYSSLAFVWAKLRNRPGPSPSSKIPAQRPMP